MAKLILYLMIMPLTVWTSDSLNISGIFKKNKVLQARIFYIMLILIISYLLVEFLYDFLHILG